MSTSILTPQRGEEWQPVPTQPLGERGGCLGRWVKRGAKKDQQIQLRVQEVTNMHQIKVDEHDESE